MNAGRCAAIAAGVLVVASFGACSEVGSDCVRLGLCPEGSGGAPAGPVTSSSGGGGLEPCAPGEPLREGGCVDDSAGVFVRTSGSDAAAGTRDAPLATLQAAVERAAAEGKLVYACAETFTERVEVPPGVEIYGALDCDQGWVWTEEGATVLEGLDASTATMIMLPGSEFTVVHDFEILGPEPQNPGESSIAVAVDNASVRFIGSLLRAREGRDGAPGAGTSVPAMAGTDGNPGSQLGSCGPSNPGGAAVSGCNGSLSGAGGPGSTSGAATSGGDASDAGATWGRGLTASAPPPVCLATTIIQGRTGASGDPGTGATGVGVIDPTTLAYVGPDGGDGTAGDDGTSGGGGGGYLYSGPCAVGAGPSGGSGGGAGCGGTPGAGGQAGGSSIGILAVQSTVDLRQSVIEVAGGGAGGQGGPGQPGGQGGDGGDGGDPNLCSHSGGDGGRGGNGGPGGGGLGGHSVGVFYSNSSVLLDDATVSLGSVGPGGDPGSGTPEAAAGAAGTAAESLEVGLL